MSVTALNPSAPAAKVEAQEAPLSGGAAAPPPRGKPRARRRAFTLLGGVVVLGLGAFGAATALAPPHAVTNDAYVAGDIVAITSRESGHVTANYAENTESVR